MLFVSSSSILLVRSSSVHQKKNFGTRSFRVYRKKKRLVTTPSSNPNPSRPAHQTTPSSSLPLPLPFSSAPKPNPKSLQSSPPLQSHPHLKLFPPASSPSLPCSPPLSKNPTSSPISLVATLVPSSFPDGPSLAKLVRVRRS